MSAVLPTYARFDLAFERGEGARLYAEDGTAYLDFTSGVAVNALGHAAPALVAALCEQADRVWHTSNLYRIPGQERLAARLCEASFADRVFFTNSGAEAVECAIKMARRFHWGHGAPERYRLVTFEGAFHGRTLATIAAGGQAKLLEGFGPPVDGFDQVPFGDLAAARAAIGPQTAGILVEPVQGEGGVRVASADFLRGLRALADEHAILLILDEVQTGMGRTGRLFAYEAAGIAPDIMAIGKGIGGGFPLGACLSTAQAGEAMTPGSHGSTYGGNPLAMAVGNAVLDAVLAPGFLERVRERGACLMQALERLAAAFPDLLREVRGKGLLCGFRSGPDVARMVRALLDQRLLTVPAGENVVRLLPPLTVTEAEIGEAMDAIARAATALKRESAT